MTTIGILKPTGLLGRELRDQLEAARVAVFGEIVLLSREAETIGTLTEVRGSAALVQPLSAETVADLALLIVCGPDREDLEAIAALPPIRLLLLAPALALPEHPTMVATEPPGDLSDLSVVVSPHPAVVGLAHLLRPLEALGLAEAVTTLLRPASVHEQSAFDEIFEQTRALLSFQQPDPGRFYPRQIAFNLLAGPREERLLVDELGSLLASRPTLAIQSLDVPVFHGLSVSLFVQLDPDTGADAVLARWSEDEAIELLEDPFDASPIAAASHDRVLVAPLQPAADRPGGFWIWAVFDNLTRGGASNAVALAAAMLGAPIQAR